MSGQDRILAALQLGLQGMELAAGRDDPAFIGYVMAADTLRGAIELRRAELAGRPAKPEDEIAAVQRLAWALSFYADPDRYKGANRLLDDGEIDPFGGGPYLQDVTRDAGEIARRALAGLPANPETVTLTRDQLLALVPCDPIDLSFGMTTVEAFNRGEQNIINEVRGAINRLFATECKAAGDFTPEQVQQAEEEPPSWKTAPEWAEWRAKDYCGAWSWYENEPTPTNFCYTPRPGDRWLFAGNFRPFNDCDWRKTLERRPPSCQHIYTEWGYGYAAGPLGAYRMCVACSAVVEFKADTEGCECQPVKACGACGGDFCKDGCRHAQENPPAYAQKPQQPKKMEVEIRHGCSQHGQQLRDCSQRIRNQRAEINRLLAKVGAQAASVPDLSLVESFKAQLIESVSPLLWPHIEAAGAVIIERMKAAAPEAPKP